MPVSNINVFCFRNFKRPIISALWYVLLCYTIWNPSEILPSILSIVFLLITLTPLRIILAALSPVPCIAEMILSFSVFIDIKPTIILIAGILWLIIWLIGVGVWRNIVKGIYVLDPMTGVLFSTKY